MADIVTPTHVINRPWQVSLAVILYVVSLSLGAIVSALLWRYFTSRATVGFVIYVQLATFAVLALLVFKMWRGRNWARITNLVLYLIGLPFYFPQLSRYFSESFAGGCVSLTQCGLQFIGLGLVFIGPGRTWFRVRQP
jgi:predicted membrane channel-forming protein YqfA (hemolysin III family)